MAARSTAVKRRNTPKPPGRDGRRGSIYDRLAEARARREVVLAAKKEANSPKPPSGEAGLPNRAQEMPAREPSASSANADTRHSVSRNVPLRLAVAAVVLAALGSLGLLGATGGDAEILSDGYVASATDTITVQTPEVVAARPIATSDSQTIAVASDELAEPALAMPADVISANPIIARSVSPQLSTPDVSVGNDLPRLAVSPAALPANRQIAGGTLLIPSASSPESGFAGIEASSGAPQPLEGEDAGVAPFDVTLTTSFQPFERPDLPGFALSFLNDINVHQADLSPDTPALVEPSAPIKPMTGGATVWNASPDLIATTLFTDDNFAPTVPAVLLTDDQAVQSAAPASWRTTDAEAVDRLLRDLAGPVRPMEVRTGRLEVLEPEQRSDQPIIATSAAIDEKDVVLHVPVAVSDARMNEIRGDLGQLDSLGQLKEQRVRVTISQSNVRYFHAEDRAGAEELAIALGAVPRDFTSFRPSPPSGLIEVWMQGKSGNRRAAPTRTRSSGGDGGVAQLRRDLSRLRSGLLRSLRTGRRN